MRVLTVILAITQVPGVAFGLLTRAGAYTRLSEDEQRVLVMRTPASIHDHQDLKEIVLTNGRRIDPYKEYSRSGVYLVGDSSLVYPINWYWDDESLLANEDFTKICTLNRSGDPWALQIFHLGISRRVFALDEILLAFSGDVFRPFTTWNYHLQWVDESVVNGSELTLHTIEREVAGVKIGFSETIKVSLDKATILDRSIRWSPQFIFVVASFAGLLLYLCYLAMRLTRRASGTNKHPQNKLELAKPLPRTNQGRNDVPNP